MATTDNCNGFLNRLESWIEGERPADAKVHLRDCTSCQAVIADLNAIQTEARSWNALETEAPERVWTALRTQLEQEGLIRTAETDRVVAAVAAPSHADWLRGLFSRIPRPALAGAYLSILVALGFALSGPANRQSNGERWLHGTEVETSPLSAKLNSFEQNPLASRDLNPAVTASLQQNLAIVDNYISLCEKSVQEEPENEVARDYLYEAYQQKADLLAQIGERGENVQ
jgi:hypothetical protein